MTREQAIKILKSKMDGHTDTSYEWAETIRMAIKALEQEPCEDTISRQEVLDKMKERDEELSSICPKDIKALPPVLPQPKVGRYVPVGYDGYADGNPVYDWWECSECGWEHTGDKESLTAFCPNCGAKMEVKE